MKEHMILDEGCAERGCPMHDSRETKGVVFIRKEWVGLTKEEIETIELLKAPPVHPDFVDCDDWVEFAQAIEAKLKEKNT